MTTQESAVILLVDDDDNHRHRTAEILHETGFAVRQAASGAEALRLVRDRPDLIILNARLPDMSGLEVCRRIRADAASAVIPLLHLSDAAPREDGALEGGADGYLVKPVEPNQLVAHVRALLRLRWAEACLRESEERYRLIADNSSAAVFVLDDRGSVLFANRAAQRVFGYAFDEIENLNIGFLMPDWLNGRQPGGTAWTGHEFRGKQKNGRDIVLDVSFGEFLDTRRRRRFVGVVHDVTLRNQAEQALASIPGRLVAAREAERRHIARELHDEVSQGLVALKFTLHALQTAPVDDSPRLLREADDLLARVIPQVRTLSRELGPPMMDELGLLAALRWHVKGVTERTGLPVQLDADPRTGRLPADLEMACFRVVQEALNNTAKHAQARSASVELGRDACEVYLVVSDDGMGFDISDGCKRNAQGTSRGLLGMQERVQLLGGRLVIHSDMGKGTEVRARFPLPQPGPGEGAV